MRDMKLASSGIALLIGLIVVLGMAGCYAISRMRLPDINPAVQAITYDINRFTSNRHAYTFRDGAFIAVPDPPSHPGTPIPATYPEPPPLPADLPSSWDVRCAIYDDLSGDGIPEYILLVWRPWRDLPFMEYSNTESPIVDAHDANGDSCQVILIDPAPAAYNREPSPTNRSYRQVWAGSALLTPLVRIAVGDVDGDECNELVGLEGAYTDGRTGPGCCVTVWRWDEFGFSLQWRSEQRRFTELSLEDINADGIADIIAR